MSSGEEIKTQLALSQLALILFFGLVGCTASFKPLTASLNSANSGSGNGYTLGTTVPLATLTANNTAASSAFTDIYMNYITNTVGTAGMPTTNADAIPANISNVSVHTLLPNHPNMKIFVETQDWFGHTDSNTVNGKLINNAEYYSSLDVGYDSAVNGPAQVDDMVRRGIDGASVNWYGPGTIGDNATAAMFAHAAAAYNGKFQMTVDIDKGAFDSPPAPCANLDATTTATCYLDYINTNYGSSPVFMTMNGKKVVMWFITGQTIDASINWVTVKAHAASLNMLMITENPYYSYDFYNGSGFADGVYAWVDPDGSEGLSFLNNVAFPAAQAHPSVLAIGGAWRGFDDVAASWSGNGHMPTMCGKAWLDSFAANDATSTTLSAVMIDTWDDYAEGSEIETGIDNCLSSVSVSVSNGSLNWTSNFTTDPWSAVVGSENSLSNYEIWVSNDGGANVALAQTVAPTGAGSGSIAISSLSIPSGNYLAYVRAVGKASIQNHTSTGIAITR